MYLSCSYNLDSPVPVKSHPVFSLASIEPAESSFPLQGECIVNLCVVNNLLESIIVNSAKVALINTENSDPLNQSHNSTSSLPSLKRMHRRESSFSLRSRHSSTSSAQEIDIYGPDTIPPSAALAELDMAAQWERTVNQTVLSTSIVCKTPLKRLHSSSDLWKDKDILKVDYSQALVCGEVVLHPGENRLVLTGSVSRISYVVNVRVHSINYIYIRK